MVRRDDTNYTIRKCVDGLGKFGSKVVIDDHNHSLKFKVDQW